jgi:hypothetical protein
MATSPLGPGDISLRDFIEAVGSADTAHGAVSTAAVAGGLGSSLLLMVAALPQTRSVCEVGRPLDVRSRILKTTALAAVAGAMWTQMPQVSLRLRRLSLKCWFMGHDDWIRRTPDRLYLEWFECGRETPGWLTKNHSVHRSRRGASLGQLARGSTVQRLPRTDETAARLVTEEGTRK